VVKVFKSVGAVRVYNPWNAVWAALGIVLLVAGIGFAIGWFANNGSDSSTTSSVVPSDVAGRQAAYQSGLAAGRRQGAAAASKKTAAVKPVPRTPAAPVTGSFKSGSAYVLNGITSPGAYFVQVARGGSGLHIGPHVSAQGGNTYWLCGGGTRVCYAQGNAPSR
jgi:hypothetical protein